MPPQSREVQQFAMINKRETPVMIQIDLTPDGEFLSGQTLPQSSFGNQVLRVALVVACLAIVGVMAAFAFWVFVTLIPIAIGAGVLAYGIIRYRMWQARRRG